MLTEKPSASNAQEAREVRDAAAQAGVTLMEGFHYRVEELGRRSSYTFQLDALAAHLCDGGPIVTDADDAVATMELIDATYRAAGLEPRPRHAPVAAG